MKARVHVALPVSDLEASIRFYEILFAVPPIKVKEDYAKFDVPEPSLNLSLNVVSKEMHAMRKTRVDSVSHWRLQTPHCSSHQTRHRSSPA